MTLHMFINQHCTYKGIETKGYAMQGIYSAEEFKLSETVHYLDTSDEETIWVSEISSEKPKAVVIYLTGIMQPSVTYFYGHAKMMLKEGIASLLLEVRSHGQSTGNRIGLGYTELPDVKAVIEYIKSQKKYEDVPIILMGVSMGGTIALNAFGQIDNIDVCIAMSPYASFEDQRDLLMKNYYIPDFLRSYEMLFLTPVLNLNYTKEAVDTLKPKEQIKNANGRAVAIVACAQDASVSVENTHIIEKEAPYATEWIRDSWKHFIIKDCDFRNVENDKEYCDFIKSFT